MAWAMSGDGKLAVHAKGQRPQFFDDPAVDKLLAIVMALVGEVAVLRDRNDTLERLVDEKGLINKEEIDSYKPSEEARDARDAWRAEYLSHILRVVDVDTDDMGRNDTSEEWKKIMASVDD